MEDFARIEEIRRRAGSILGVQRNPRSKVRMPVKVNVLAEQDIPWLLSHIEELEKENERLREVERVAVAYLEGVADGWDRLQDLVGHKAL